MGSALDYYYNKSKIWLPMKAENHDPSNVRTLDVSGYGNHAVFGDGVTTSTFPTKLQKRGYRFPGASGTVRFELSGNFEGDNTYTVVVQNNLLNIAGGYYWDTRQVGGFNFAAWDVAPDAVLVSSGTVYINEKSSTAMGGGGRLLAITAAGQVATAAVTSIYLGTRFNFLDATALKADMLHFSLIPIALSASQVADFHRELLAEVNHV